MCKHTVKLFPSTQITIPSSKGAELQIQTGKILWLQTMHPVKLHRCFFSVLFFSGEGDGAVTLDLEHAVQVPCTTFY